MFPSLNKYKLNNFYIKVWLECSKNKKQTKNQSRTNCSLATKNDLRLISKNIIKNEWIKIL